ncbi:MAG: hypothetical protein H6708_10530 [Kofleriaceae bacterium]|nr:hypothetical protein [Myxococcales bacterium]MCB9560831.1 hypothetical protein [Kofleriaceae bacterium]
MRFDEVTRARLRVGLMRRGLDLATLLAEILAGKDKQTELEALGLDARPGARPEELLRAALEQIEARRRLLDASDDQYGRCDVCGVDLELAALGELPWADRCQRHMFA